jgi:hypothetical protein
MRSAFLFLSFGFFFAQSPQAWSAEDPPVSSTNGAKNPSTDSASSGDVQVGKQIPLAVQPQAWQARRAEFAGAIKAANADGKDETAHNTIDRILTDYEHHPNGRTPMEVMDILGMFYLPKNGIRKGMPVVVREAVLGWYDTLQWASDSGRAEIVNNEKFLVRAFLLAGGKKASDEWVAIIKNEPEEAKKIVAEGIRFATQPGVADGGYDHKWPTAYGLERTISTLKGEPEQATAANPRMSHDEAMAEAVKRITAYYLPGLQ